MRNRRKVLRDGAEPGPGGGAVVTGRQASSGLPLEDAIFWAVQTLTLNQEQRGGGVATPLDFDSDSAVRFRGGAWVRPWVWQEVWSRSWIVWNRTLTSESPAPTFWQRTPHHTDAVTNAHSCSCFSQVVVKAAIKILFFHARYINFSPTLAKGNGQRRLWDI